MNKCIVLELEDYVVFQRVINEYLNLGYKIESSSCNSRYYKEILILQED